MENNTIRFNDNGIYLASAEYTTIRGNNISNSTSDNILMINADNNNITGNRLINASDISYQIAPRINSSGRLDSESAQTPLNLLLSTSIEKCSEYSQKLENHNHKRKTLSRELELKIEKIILKQSTIPSILMVFEPDIPIGLAGIAAGHISRKYNLPAIVGQTGADNTTASCRSIPDFNIIRALDSSQDLFIHYGGHALAAGFTIKNSFRETN